MPIASVPAPEPASPGPSLSTAEKVALFRRLFDTGHPALLRMWEKRQRGYRAMGYRVGVDTSDGQASMEDVEVPGLAPFKQLIAGQEAAAGAANGLGP